MQKAVIVCAILVLTLLPLSALALGDGNWGYDFVPSSDKMRGLEDVFSHEQIAQTFQDTSGTFPLNQQGNQLHSIWTGADYYRVFAFVKESRTIRLFVMCGSCYFSLNDQRLDDSVLGAIFGSYNHEITLTLSKGWNKIEVVHGDVIGGKVVIVSPFPFPAFGLKEKLSSQVDAVSSFQAICDPATQECCAEPGKSFKSPGSSCDSGGGQCNDKGVCVNADSGQEACKNAGGSFLSGAAANACCGDDATDCGAVNAGHYCIPGSGWINLAQNRGQVFSLGCAGPVSAVLDSSGAHHCYTGPIPLNHPFSYEILVPRGDGKWEYKKDGVKQQPIDDEDVTATAYGGGTLTYLRTTVLLPEEPPSGAGSSLTINCDASLSGVQGSGPETESFVLVNGNNVGFFSGGAGSGIKTVGLTLNKGASFKKGANTVEIFCKNDGAGSGNSHIVFSTPFSSLPGVLVVSSTSKNLFETVPRQIPSPGLKTKSETIENLDNLVEEFSAPDPAKDDDVASFFDEGGSGGQQQTQDVAPPKSFTFQTSDPDVVFEFGGKQSNPMTTTDTGIVKAIFTGPEPQRTQFSAITVNNHGYLCAPTPGDDSTRVVVECAGEQKDYFSSSPTVHADVGDSFDMPLTSGTGLVRHWCSSTSKQWVTDLDSPLAGSLTCVKAKDPAGVPLKFASTGTLCCSDDSGESYNDPWDGATDQHGGCFKDKKIDFGDFPLDTSPRTAQQGTLINHLGVFASCGLTDTSVLSLLDLHQKGGLSGQLIKQSAVCDVLANARGSTDFYCSPAPQNAWKAVDDDRPRILMTDVATSKTECCAQGDCFDGTTCIKNQADDPSFVLHNGKRCIDGAFELRDPQFRFDRTQKGFCPLPTQCLVNLRGTKANNNKPEFFFTSDPTTQPVCISDGQFIEEYLCEKGNWTSRTKYLALALDQHAQSVGGGYTIFCDNYDNVLNFFSYTPLPEKGQAAAEFLESSLCRKSPLTNRNLCVNQFCGMNYKDGIAFAVSLNAPLNDPKTKDISFLGALGLSSSVCDAALLALSAQSTPPSPQPLATQQQANAFVSCTNEVYYNPALHSILYLPKGQLSTLPLVQLNAQQEALTAPMSAIISQAKKSLNPSGFLISTSIFSRLFIDKRAEQEFFSVVETKISDEERSNLPNTYVAGVFTGISASGETTPCTLLSTVDPAVTGSSGFCVYDSATKQLVFTRYSLGEAQNPLATSWRDVTAKLRVGK